MKQKKCNSCKRLLPLSNFTKNKNTKDHLSYYCKECTKKHKKLYYYQQGDKKYESVIIESLQKDKDVKINGLNKDKVINTVVLMYDLPGVLNNLLVDLPIFLKKYDFTYEEYKFFIQQCHRNKFWIQPKGLNTSTN